MQNLSLRSAGMAVLAAHLILGAGGSPEPSTIAESAFPLTNGAVVQAAEDQIFNDGGSSTAVSYSLVEGGLSAGSVDGGGNLDADPLLQDEDGADNIPGSVDDEVGIQSTSPAINAGSDAALPADKFDLDGDGDTNEPIPTDIAGAARAFSPSGGGNAVDMGALESEADNIASERFRDAPGLPLEFAVPYPNPVSDAAELTFRLPVTERIEVAVFDLLGRRQTVLFDDVAEKDREYRLRIPAANLASGVYFARIRSASFEESRNFVVAR